MAYNEDKDKLIKMFEYTDDKGGSVMFSVFSYDNGPKKLGISRSYNKKDGTVGYGPMGRLSLSELNFFKDKIEDILKEM
jgi:hypothetical protein